LRNRNFPIQIILVLADAVLINGGFIGSFLLRYGFTFPDINFNPYKSNFIFLTLIYVLSLALFGTYKSRFKSSWVLFEKVFLGLFLGTLMSIAFVYVFRIKWGSFPTSVFLISFFINIFLIFRFNRVALRICRRIKKKVAVLGQVNIDDFMVGKANIEKIEINKVEELINCADIDEIIICDPIPNEKDMSFITYLAQKLKIEVVFGPVCYAKLLPGRINGDGSEHPLATFVGRKRDAEEFLIRSFDVLSSLVILVVSLPLTILIGILIKLTSKGPVLYKQQRVGKDGMIFTLYKFRTMVHDAEKQLGPVWAAENDPRVTKVGRFLRDTRFDEIPQLVNVILGQMSLVGPRPERPYFVKRHKALMEIRLAVKPGLTGLAQVRSAYNLHPNHKLKYDYLYIQRRSLILNLYILAKTIPVVLLKKGQ